ncbi:hypothetical protein L6452_22943 [Arctium lappa]|uniref:Uncharacterized protein n=1 Tax=Arctium lappa TaxID=4217 RepID=A0ACB9B205_ARCLA|nr:hypothetical protein L6452_22943 [Arctium lappa]
MIYVYLFFLVFHHHQTLDWLLILFPKKGFLVSASLSGELKIYDGAKRIWSSKGEEMQKGGQELIGYLKVLEGELGEKPYFMGESFGYVDIVLISYYHHLLAYEILGKFSVKQDCPKLFGWATKCMEKKSVSKTLADPKRIYEATIEFSIKSM